MIPSLDRFTKNSYPGVFCAVVILLLTGLPGSLLPKAKPAIGLDKIVHIIMFSGFSFITLWGYRKSYQENGKSYQKKAIIITVVIGILFGAVTEIMQEACIPGRNGSIFDWIADTLGAILGVCLYYFYNRKRNNLKNAAFRK